MAQIIFLAIVAVAGYAGYRSLTREAKRVSARVRRAEEEARTGSTGTLVKDPKTGEYRPARD